MVIMIVTLKVSPISTFCVSGFIDSIMLLWAFDLEIVTEKKDAMIRITSRGLQSALRCLRFNTLKQEDKRATFKFIDMASKHYIICLGEASEEGKASRL
jgi:hypothetical protein